MPYSEEQIGRMARIALEARDRSDPRFVRLVMRLQRHMSMRFALVLSPSRIIECIEDLAAN